MLSQTVQRISKTAAVALIMAAAFSYSAEGDAPVVYLVPVLNVPASEKINFPGEPVGSVKLVACRGELESVMLGIRGGDIEGKWKIAVSDLYRGENKISSFAVEIAAMKWKQPSQARRGHPVKNDWYIYPGVTEIELKKGKTVPLWLTVRVPRDAAAGKYSGKLVLASPRKGATPAEIPFRLEVLPAVLEDVPGVNFCLLFTSAFAQYHDLFSRRERYENAVAFYRELKDLGMTCVSPHCSDWHVDAMRKTGSGYISGHFEGLEACMEVAKEVGLRGPVIWYMSALINGVKGGKNFSYYDGKCDNWNKKRDLANLREIIKEVKRREKLYDWPEIVFYTCDEPGTQTENVRMRALRLGEILPETMKVINSLGARGSTTITEPVDDRHNSWNVNKPNELREMLNRSRPYINIRIYGYGAPQGPTNLYFEQKNCRKYGHEMWWYYNPTVYGGNRRIARLFFGLWGWKVDADGLTAWTYPKGRTVQLEAVREGIDDRKYIALIEKAIKEKRGGEEAIATAKAFLLEVRKGLVLSEDGYITDWNAFNLEVFKKKAVEQIRALYGG